MVWCENYRMIHGTDPSPKEVQDHMMVLQKKARFNELRRTRGKFLKVLKKAKLTKQDMKKFDADVKMITFNNPDWALSMEKLIEPGLTYEQ